MSWATCSALEVLTPCLNHPHGVNLQSRTGACCHMQPLRALWASCHPSHWLSVSPESLHLPAQ